MAAAGAEHRRRTIALNSASTSSLEKLIQESSSSAGSSARSSSHGWDETLPLGGGGRGDDPSSIAGSSWSFEGERDCGGNRGGGGGGMTNKREFVDRGDCEHGNVGRCVAGCAADCTALCCCPLTLFHVLALLVVKIPSSMAAKLAKMTKKKSSSSSKLQDKKESFGADGGSWGDRSRFVLWSSQGSGESLPPSPPRCPRLSPLRTPPSPLAGFWRDFGSGRYSP